MKFYLEFDSILHKQHSVSHLSSTFFNVLSNSTIYASKNSSLPYQITFQLLLSSVYFIISQQTFVKSQLELTNSSQSVVYSKCFVSFLIFVTQFSNLKLWELKAKNSFRSLISELLHCLQSHPLNLSPDTKQLVFMFNGLSVI